MSAILSFLGGIKAILIALAIGLVLGAVGAGWLVWDYRGAEVKAAQADQRTAETGLSTAKGANDTLTSTLAEQKTAMDKLQADADARKAAADKAVQAAQALAMAANNRAAQLAARPPSDPGNVCASISDLRRDYMQGRGK